MALVVKNLPANAEDLSDMELSLRWEDCLEEGMASHSSTLAWRIPWTEEPGRLQSIGSQRVKHDWRDLACIHKEWHTLFLFKCFRTSSEMPFSNYNPSFKNLLPQESLNKPVSNLLNKAHLGVIVYLILFLKVSRWDSHLQCKYQNDWKGLFRDTPTAMNSLTVSKFTK